MESISKVEELYNKKCNNIDKLIKEFSNGNMKQNGHKLIEIKEYITDMNDLVSNLTKENSSRTDIPEIDRINRDKLISKIKNNIHNYREEYEKLRNLYSKFDEKAYLYKKTDVELRELREKKEAQANNKINNLYGEAKKYNVNLREIGDLLDKDKIINDSQHNAVS